MKPLVVYDGTCGICAGNLKWLRRLDWLHVFDDLPYQSEELYRRHPHVERAACEQALHVVFPDGRTWSGADAFRVVFLRLPLTFVLGLLLALPPLRQLARRLYPVVARNRYRWGGHCPLPAPTSVRGSRRAGRPGGRPAPPTPRR